MSHMWQSRGMNDTYFACIVIIIIPPCAVCPPLFLLLDHAQVPDPLLAGHQHLPAPHCGSVKVQEQPIRHCQEDHTEHITKQSLTAHP